VPGWAHRAPNRFHNGIAQAEGITAVVNGASELLRPHDARIMRCYPVSTRINRVANDDEECSRPIEFAENQSRLFG
jgi:hypothetical protein